MLHYAELCYMGHFKYRVQSSFKKRNVFQFLLIKTHSFYNLWLVEQQKLNKLFGVLEKAEQFHAYQRERDNKGQI